MAKSIERSRELLNSESKTETASIFFSETLPDAIFAKSITYLQCIRFFFWFQFLVKRGLSNPYTYSYIHMHDLYKYIIYKLATPSGIVH